MLLGGLNPGTKPNVRKSRAMKGAANLARSGLARPLALALALLSLIFLFQVTPHGHTNGQDEAACRLCQAAHIGVAQALTAVALVVPLIPSGRVSITTLTAETKFFFAHSPSRAPPSHGN
jgi:hypothetical protein